MDTKPPEVPTVPVEDELDTQVGARDAEDAPPEYVGKIGLAGTILIIGFIALSPLARDRLGKYLGVIAVGTMISLVPADILGTILKIPIIRAQLFLGGALLRLRLKTTWFVLGWIPLGGYIKWIGDREATESALNPPPRWRQLSRWTRAFIFLVGPMMGLFCAILVLGKDEGWASFIRTPGQLAQLFAHPINTMHKMLVFIDYHGFSEILGRTTAKFSVIDLLPLTVMTGGGAIVEFFNLKRFRRPYGYAELVSILVLLVGYSMAIYGAARAWSL